MHLHAFGMPQAHTQNRLIELICGSHMYDSYTTNHQRRECNEAGNWSTHTRHFLAEQNLLQMHDMRHHRTRDRGTTAANRMPQTCEVEYMCQAATTPWVENL